MNKILYDYHTHSWASHDSKTPMEDMCEQAIKIGIKEIAFTEHFDYEDFGEPITAYVPNEHFSFFESELEKCIMKYGDKITIIRAHEIGQMHLCYGASKKLINDMSFDFIIGSLHKFHNCNIGKETFDEKNYMQYTADYFENVLLLAQIGDFDCLGHIDMIKRHTCKYGFVDAHKYFYPEMKKIIDTLISRGRGIELNMSSLRQAPKDTMPSLDILKYYKEKGGEIITVGSDAHTPLDIASGFSIAYDMLIDAGFKHLTTFKNRQPKFVKL